MEPMVSRRAQLPLRSRADMQSKELESNPTELINKAYEFADASGSLLRVRPSIKPGERQPTATQRQETPSFFEQVTYAVPESHFAKQDYDAMLEDEVGREYEGLS